MRLLLDAEQTCMQPAVDALAVAFQRTYNQEAAVLLNTYQCYLKVGPPPDCPARSPSCTLKALPWQFLKEDSIEGSLPPLFKPQELLRAMRGGL